MMRPQTYCLLGILATLLIALNAQATDFQCPGQYYYAVYNWGGCGGSINDRCVGCSRSEACGAAGLTYAGSGASCLNHNDYPVVSSTSHINPCYGNEVNTMYSSSADACVEPPPPPPPTDAECVAEHGPGWIYSSLTIGDQDHGSCIYTFPNNDQEDCELPLGSVTYNGETEVVCADDRDQCANAGGYWGTWGEAGSEVTGCVPGDFGDGLPTCDSSGAFVADAESGSFVCESPLQQLPDLPNINDPNSIDTDGDGTPDKNDDDIDGDGIANGSDPDRDGDGIANEDDLTPDGEEEEESSVEGGVDCQVAPRCSGDAIQCSILYQVWKGRCEAEKESEEDTVTEASVQSGNEPGQLFSDVDLTNDIDGFLNQTGIAGTCPAPETLILMGTTVEVPYTAFCDFATLVRPFVVFLFGFIGFRIVMRAF